jgi:predicted ATPase
MLTRMLVSNFRCIKELNLELPPFTVLIGPNGAGKSTFLHSFRMLRSIATQELSSAFRAYGGFNAATCVHADEPTMSLAVVSKTDNSHLNYAIVLEQQGSGFYVGEEEVTRAPESVYVEHAWEPPGVLPHEPPRGPMTSLDKAAGCGSVFRSVNGHHEWVGHDKIEGTNPGKSAEAYLPSLSERNPEILELLDSFRGISLWNAIDFDPEAIRRPQILEPTSTLTHTGDNLLSVLYTLKTEKRDLYQELIETLQVAFPELESIELPLAGKGYASLNWFQEGMSKPFDAQQLSDGTLRLLWLVTLLFTVPDDSVVLIDEPEISLHPQWLMFLVSLLRMTSARAQIIIATHSDQIIRWVEPKELLVADIEEGVSRFRWGKDMDLKEWLKEYTIDQLWQMGELGGRR